MRKYLYTITLIAFPITLPAQQVFNDGSVISITEGTIFTATNLTNNGLIINNGRMLIRGTWQNNAEYDSGTGSMVLFSDQPQVVNHNAKTFTRLEIAGGGEKIFAADLTVENELILTDGILNSNNNSRIIFMDGAQITGGSDQAYIDGQVIHVGTGEKLYPLGKDGIYYPITFTNITDTDLELAVDLAIPNPVSGFSGILEGVTENVAWTLNELQGNFSGSPVTVAVRNENFSGNTEDVVVVQSSDLSSNYQPIGNSGFGGDFQEGLLTSQLDADLPIISYGFLSANPEFPISVYNAVSPNNDGQHDYLNIENIGFYEGNYVIIYNRWGDKVFEMRDYDSNDPGKRFDGNGNLKGYQELPDGTYYYTIDANDDSIKKISGFFVLKR